MQGSTAVRQGSLKRRQIRGAGRTCHRWFDGQKLGEVGTGERKWRIYREWRSSREMEGIQEEAPDEQKQGRLRALSSGFGKRAGDARAGTVGVAG